MLRWLERAIGMDIEGMRAGIEAGLARAHEAAQLIGGGDYLILSAGFVYVVREGVVTTVIEQHDARETARLLGDRPQK